MTGGPTKIAVIGSINMDLITKTTRLPRIGETVLGDRLQYRSGGKGANQAVAAARYGADVAFLGATGQDGFGRQLRAALASAGLALDDVRSLPGQTSGAAFIVVDGAGDNMITAIPGTNWSLTSQDVDAFKHRLAGADVLLVQLEIPLPVVLAAIRLANTAGVLVVLNAAPADHSDRRELDQLVAQCDVLLVNETEADCLGASGANWVDKARSLTARGPETVVITLGAAGAVAVDGAQAVFQPAFQVEVVDAIGAGDAFSAALAVELGRQTPLPDAVRLACAAGALATTGTGGQEALPSYSQVETWLGEGILPAFGPETTRKEDQQ
ncbi:MAG: ribokinase [Bifidobacteriaceae bacterium]|jgi:ribokinase|nr:ribokinase [Bifidobacteriaceae bacterium]